MKKYFILWMTISLTTVAHASLDCSKECSSDPYQSKCYHFGFPVKYAVKTILDILNQYIPTRVPNVSYSPCTRQMIITGFAFENNGGACLEYSVPPLSEPGDPVDPNNQYYVKLPAILKGEFISDSQKIVFADTNMKPIFEATSEGQVWTSGLIDSAFLLNLGSERTLVLESQNMCYSIFVSGK